MSQRINITYSIKIENLELEVKRLLTVALDKLEDVYTSNSHLEDRPVVLEMETYKDIDDLRQGLAEVDVALADINNLVSSYLNYETQQLQPPPSPSAADPGEPEIELSHIESQLSQFKKDWELSANNSGDDFNEISD
jgi:hypothetical protein